MHPLEKYRIEKIVLNLNKIIPHVGEPGYEGYVRLAFKELLFDIWDVVPEAVDKIVVADHAFTRRVTVEKTANPWVKLFRPFALLTNI